MVPRTPETNSLLRIYEILRKEYGPQGWWPIHGTYDGRTPNSDEQFEICIGAILTQNTAWTNVERALENIRGKLNRTMLENLSSTELATLIRPAGYFNQKAKKIRCFIAFLNSGKPITRKNLLSVWGLGPETVDSILLYAYGKPYFVVDAYTRRILSYLGIITDTASYDEIQHLFHKTIPPSVQVYKEYHALFVAHGKTWYSKKPYGVGDTLLQQFIPRRSLPCV